MKAVIFGAGASFDSVYEYYEPMNPFHNSSDKPTMDEIIGYYKSISDYQFKSPLTKDLFSPKPEFKKILDKYPGAKSLASMIFERDKVEKCLEELKIKIENHRNDQLLAKFINIQFYLRELFGNVSAFYNQVGYSNYEALVNYAHDYSRATDEDVIFISFNYDLLLEQAVERVTLRKIKNIDDYINGHIKIFKPHGSCNWFRLISQAAAHLNTGVAVLSLSDYLLNNIDKYSLIKPQLDEQILLGNWNEADIFVDGNVKKYKMPQIAVPLLSKTDFLMPSNHL